MTVGGGPQVRVGTSGWSYPGWRRGRFYPPGVPVRAELAYLAGMLNSVEINGSFYALQRPSSYLSWAAQTPADFVFAVKGGRFVTHLKRLTEPGRGLANFFASGILGLETRLGPVLWQLPTGFAPDPLLLEAFLVQLPRTLAAAAELARGHDARFADRVLTSAAHDGPLRHAIELRSDQALQPGIVALLRASGVALVASDGAGRWPLTTEVTADFAYVRLHGSRELYRSAYRPAELDRWAARIRSWNAGGLDVFVYFDNDTDAHAPRDAIALRRRLEPLGATGTAAGGDPPRAAPPPSRGPRGRSGPPARGSR